MHWENLIGLSSLKNLVWYLQPLGPDDSENMYAVELREVSENSWISQISAAICLPEPYLLCRLQKRMLHAPSCGLCNLTLKAWLKTLKNKPTGIQTAKIYSVPPLGIDKAHQPKKSNVNQQKLSQNSNSSFPMGINPSTACSSHTYFLFKVKFLTVYRSPLLIKLYLSARIITHRRSIIYSY